MSINAGNLNQNPHPLDAVQAAIEAAALIKNTTESPNAQGAAYWRIARNFGGCAPHASSESFQNLAQTLLNACPSVADALAASVTRCGLSGYGHLLAKIILDAIEQNPVVAASGALRILASTDCFTALGYASPNSSGASDFATKILQINGELPPDSDGRPPARLTPSEVGDMKSIAARKPKQAQTPTYNATGSAYTL